MRLWRGPENTVSSVLCVSWKLRAINPLWFGAFLQTYVPTQISFSLSPVMHPDQRKMAASAIGSTRALYHHMCSIFFLPLVKDVSGRLPRLTERCAVSPCQIHNGTTRDGKRPRPNEAIKVRGVFLIPKRRFSSLFPSFVILPESLMKCYQYSSHKAQHFKANTAGLGTTVWCVIALKLVCLTDVLPYADDTHVGGCSDGTVCLIHYIITVMTRHIFTDVFLKRNCGCFLFFIFFTYCILPLWFLWSLRFPVCTPTYQHTFSLWFHTPLN